MWDGRVESIRESWSDPWYRCTGCGRCLSCCRCRWWWWCHWWWRGTGLMVMVVMMTKSIWESGSLETSNPGNGSGGRSCSSSGLWCRWRWRGLMATNNGRCTKVQMVTRMMALEWWGMMRYCWIMMMSTVIWWSMIGWWWVVIGIIVATGIIIIGTIDICSRWCIVAVVTLSTIIWYLPLITQLFFPTPLCPSIGKPYLSKDWINFTFRWENKSN